MTYKYTFTVFTPTYNMGGAINRVWNSLKKQTFHDFEWIVVDDGSEDDTKIKIQKWKKESKFPLHYIYQPNSGKHIARNAALKLSSGSLFTTIDADDEVVEDYLEFFYDEWQKIRNKEKYSGIACPCLDSATGKVIGKSFPFEVLDSNDLEIKYLYKLWGDKCGICRTEILRQFPFPELPGQKFILESFVWNQIAVKYVHRYINKPLKIVHRDTPNSLSKTPNNFLYPLGYYEYHLMNINIAYDYLKLSKSHLIRTLINLSRFGLHSKVSIIETIKRITSMKNKIAVLLLLPMAIIYTLNDKAKNNI